MKPEQFKDLVKNHFFSVTFTKKDGSLRSMTARCGVSKHVKGTGKPITGDRIGVFEVSGGRDGAECYRSLYPEKVVSLKVGGKVYDGEGKEVSTK